MSEIFMWRELVHQRNEELQKKVRRAHFDASDAAPAPTKPSRSRTRRLPPFRPTS